MYTIYLSIIICVILWVTFNYEDTKYVKTTKDKAWNLICNMTSGFFAGALIGLAIAFTYTVMLAIHIDKNSEYVMEETVTYELITLRGYDKDIYLRTRNYGYKIEYLFNYIDEEGNVHENDWHNVRTEKVKLKYSNQKPKFEYTSYRYKKSNFNFLENTIIDDRVTLTVSKENITDK